MARIVGFEQDPSGPTGMGTFHFDDGRQLYAHEPEMAASIQPPAYEVNPELAAAAQPAPDQRMASGFQTTDQRLAGGGAAPGLDDQLAQMQAPQPSAPAAPPQPQAPPGPAVGGGPAPQAPPDPQAEAMKFITAPVRVGATKGGVVPKSQSQTIETEGLPYDQELADQRANANVDMMVAKRNTADTLAARAQAESLQAQSQLPELQKKAAAAQAEVAMQQQAYKEERADLERLIAESQQNQKSFNANRWFESKNAIGQIGAVLAQAMGVYAAIMGHGENWAQKVINQQIDADIANQRAQIESGKEGVNNALMKMKLRYGDMGQAESALKIAMGQMADTQALAYAKSTGSQDIINQWQEQVAKNQQERVAEEQKFMAGAIGKRKTTTDARIVAPSAGGYRDPTTAEMSARADLAGKIPDIATKTYKAEQERKKALTGVDPEKVSDSSRNLSKDTADIVKAQSELQAARDMANRYKGADSIPGLGYKAEIINQIPLGKRAFMDEEERVNYSTKERVKLAYRHAMTGAGGNIKELAGIDAAFDGAKTPAEFAAAIDQMDAALEAQRRHAESGYDPSVVRLNRERGAYEPKKAPATLQREDM